MGSNQSDNNKRKSEIQIPNVVKTQVYMNVDEQKLFFCCGIQLYKKKCKQVWKVRFQQNIQELKNYYSWALELFQSYEKILNIPRIQYLKEINQLKYQYLKSKQTKFQQQMVSLQQIIDKTVLFKSQIYKSMATTIKTEKQQQIKRKNTFAVKGSILIKQQLNKKKHQRVKKLPIVSFIDESITNLFTKKKPQLDRNSQQQLKLFIRFTQLIQNHCKKNDNFLCIMKQRFIEYLVKTYKIQQKNESGLTKDVLQFIQLYKQTILDFYKIQILQELFSYKDLFNQQNMMNLTTSLLFKDQRIYNILYQMYSSNNIQQQKQMQLIMSKNDILPQDFLINVQYCLNKATVDNYIQKMSVQSNIQNMEFSAIVDFTPYQNCISKLKQLDNTQTPIGKLKVIISTAQKISPSITHFYQSNNLDIKHSVIDADQILSIFCFITAKSKIKNIYTHLKIIQNFASKDELKSMTGYYYNVVLSAVETVKDLNRKRQVSFKTANFG